MMYSDLTRQRVRSMTPNEVNTLVEKFLAIYMDPETDWLDEEIWDISEAMDTLLDEVRVVSYKDMVISPSCCIPHVSYSLKVGNDCLSQNWYPEFKEANMTLPRGDEDTDYWSGRVS